MNRVVAWALGLAVAVTAVGTAQAMGEVRMPNGEYFEQRVDLSVKGRGGQVQIARTWTNGRWYLNPTWADLKFTLDAIDGSVKTIDRAGAVFERTGNGDVYLFDYDTFIQRTTSPAGWRWYDRLGNEVVYDAQGRVIRYADRNGVGVRFVRDAGGDITEIRDHANAVALTLTSSGGNVTSIRDRSGRTVSYTWSNGDLTRVTDALGNPWAYTYDGNGQILTATDAEGRTTTVTYVASFRVGGAAVSPGIGFSGRPGRDFRISRVAKLRDALGAETTYTYNYIRERRHWVVTEKRPLGGTTDRTYDVEGRLVALQDGTAVTFDRRRDGVRVEFIKDERGLVTRREFDAYRKPIAVEHPDGTTERWTYDPRFSFPTEHVNEVGTRSTWRYDDKGNLVERIEAAGAPEARTTRMTYTAFGEVATMTVAGATPAEDATTTYTYDANGNVNQITDAEGGITRFTHDVMGHALTTTDARSNVWTNTYDAIGRQLTAANPLGHTTTSQYDKVGNRTRSIDPAGNATVMTYDARDRPLTTTDPLGGVSTLTYDAEGRLLTSTDASGERTTQAHDLRGRLITMTDGVGNITRTEYGTPANGLDGLIAAMVYPTFREEYRYDNRNRRTQAIRVLPAETGQPERRETTTTSYDGQGNVIAIVDALGRTTQTAFDRLNRQVEVTDPIGSKARYTYDTRGNLLSLTDANGNTHRFTFDKRDRTRTEARPMGQTIRYAYDAMGNLIERTDARNQRQIHTFDSANRKIKTETFAASSTTPAKTITYSYDARGLMTGYVDGRTSATYTYDTKGQKLNEAVNYGRFTITHSYTYHSNGQTATYTAPDGSVIGYAYTGHGELREVTLPGAGAVTMSDFRWLRPQTIRYPGGAERIQRFDALTRVQEITVRAGTEVRMDYRYAYDAVGNVTTIDTEHGRYRYAYDALDRLTEADYPNGPGNDQINDSFASDTFPFADDRFGHDPLGNRTTSQAQPGPWAYNANYELTQSPLGRRGYNEAGSTIEVRDPADQLRQRFVYDEEERPVEVANGGGQLIARYYHDPFGRRLWKTLEAGAEGHSGGAGPETVYLAYSDEGYAAEFRLPGTPATAPTQGPTAFTTVWIYAPDGLWSTDPIAIRTPQGWRYPQANHLATAQRVIDGAGATVTTLRMSAFGETRVQGEPLANRFPGQLHDAETGLHYNYHRLYAPLSGRYTQADRIGIKDGPNTFLFVHSDPVGRIDPLGLFSCCEINERTCCGEFEKREPAKVSELYGGVICCCGRKFACAFTRDRHPDIRGPARESWRRCIREHEKNHFDEVTCSSTMGPEQPNRDNNDPPHKDQQECEAYDAQVACMKREEPECHGRKDCLEQIQRILRYHLDDANRLYGCAIFLSVGSG
jgi:RHS repeat-associated protein